MARILIVAFGNPLRCDDGLAWRAAEELSRGDMGEEVQIVTTHQLMPELSHAVSQASFVLFIDAAQNGVPGELISAALQPQAQSSIFTHDFSPATILELARQLYGRCPRAILLSMCGQRFDHGEELSGAVADSLPTLIARIIQLVRGEPLEV